MLQDGTAAQFRFKSDWAGVKVETPDDFTLKLTLPKPSAPFLVRLAAYFGGIPNREATLQFEKNHTVLTPDAMPATGPFTLQQWATGKDILLKKNPTHFRKGEPHLDGIHIPWGLFEDPNAQRLAFEQKQVDSWAAPDPAATKAVIDAHKDSMIEVLTGVSNTVFLHLNMNQQFKDLRLVRAMNMAIDRRAMIQAFHQGLGQVSGPVTWLQQGWATKPEDLIKYEGYRTDRAAGDQGRARPLGSRRWAGARRRRHPRHRHLDGTLARHERHPDQDAQRQPGHHPDQVDPCHLQRRRHPAPRRRVTFVNWMAWTNAVNSPDPRLDLLSTAASTGSQNWNRINNPALDKLLADAAHRA